MRQDGPNTDRLSVNSFSFTVVQSNWMFSIHNNKTISKRKTDYTKSEYTRSAHQIFLSSALSALSTKRARARSHTHMTIYDATCSDPCIVLMLLPTVAARTRRRSERSTASAAISAISVWERASGDNECTPNGKQRTKNNASAKLTAKENRSSISAHVCVLSVCHYWLRTPLTCSVCCVNGRWCRHSSRKRERERDMQRAIKRLRDRCGGGIACEKASPVHRTLHCKTRKTRRERTLSRQKET